MNSSLINSFLWGYRWVFARRFWYRFNLHLHKLILRSLGIGNAEGSEETGEKWLLEQLKNDGALVRVFDAGANTGTYTAEVLELSPLAQVIACEPHPQTFAKLKKALKPVARHKKVKLLQVGLSSRAGKLMLWDFARHAPLKSTQPTSTLSSLHRSVIEELHQQPARGYKVALTTIDTILKTQGWTELDLLKVDTEGHELAVLKGAKRLIARQAVKVIQLEFNEMHVYSRTFVREVMAAVPSYRWYRLLPYNQGLLPLDGYRPLTHELFGFQNLVAIRPDLGLGKVGRGW